VNGAPRLRRLGARQSAAFKYLLPTSSSLPARLEDPDPSIFVDLDRLGGPRHRSTCDPGQRRHDGTAQTSRWSSPPRHRRLANGAPNRYSVSEYSTSGNDKRRYRRINDDWMQD
jgi:hypothetical protein